MFCPVPLPSALASCGMNGVASRPVVCSRPVRFHAEQPALWHRQGEAALLPAGQIQIAGRARCHRSHLRRGRRVGDGGQQRRGRAPAQRHRAGAIRNRDHHRGAAGLGVLGLAELDRAAAQFGHYQCAARRQHDRDRQRVASRHRRQQRAIRQRHRSRPHHQSYRRIRRVAAVQQQSLTRRQGLQPEWESPGRPAVEWPTAGALHLACPPPHRCCRSLPASAPGSAPGNPAAA